jgi:DNA-binding HxlR family transcriptional regulator
MNENSNVICLYPLEGIIDVISKKWSLLIVNVLGNNGKLRFNAIMEELTGISPKTLSDTLKELQGEGLIKRETFVEIPPRVEYSLTENGTELRRSIIPLIQWAAKRTSAEKGACTPSCTKTGSRHVKNIT